MKTFKITLDLEIKAKNKEEAIENALMEASQHDFTGHIQAEEVDYSPQAEINETDLEHIAGQIKEGYTSGRADDGEGKHIAWEFKTNAWKDEE
jgi:hypothetical protein